MFGENLTVEGLDESKINIGDTFSIGNAIVQVSELEDHVINLVFDSMINRLLNYLLTPLSLVFMLEF